MIVISLSSYLDFTYLMKPKPFFIKQHKYEKNIYYLFNFPGFRQLPGD